MSGGLPGSSITFPYTRPHAPANYGEAFGTLKSITLALDVATVSQEWRLTGDFLWAVKGSDNGATDLTAEVDVQFQTSGADTVPFSQGLFLPWQFSKLYLTWSAQPGKKLTLVYGRLNGTPAIPMIIANALAGIAAVSLQGNLNAVVQRPGTLVDVPDVAIAANTLVQIVAPAASSRRAILVNTGANSVRVGTNPGANTGVVVMPSGSITLMGNYVINAYGSGGASSMGGVIEAD